MATSAVLHDRDLTESQHSEASLTSIWLVSSSVVGLICALQSHLSSVAATWATIGAVFLGMKAIVITAAGGAGVRLMGLWRLLGFVFLWPGMAVEPFIKACGQHREQLRQLVAARWRRLLSFGTANAVLGSGLLWVTTYWGAVREHALVHAAVGLAGAGLLVPFGLFQILAGLWRRCGVAVEKQWQFLFASRSLAEYWSVRWNRCFHDFAREQVFRPLRSRLGSTGALFSSFLFSGLLHDLAISAPARGGYGLPTLYFLLQGAGIWFERRYLTAGWVRRAWAALVLIAPIGLLFHQPFLTRVVLPQLDALAGRAT